MPGWGPDPQVVDAHAVGVPPRKDDEPVGGRRRAGKLMVGAEGGGDGDAAEDVAGGVEDAHAVRVGWRKDDEPVGGSRRAAKLVVDAEGGGDVHAAKGGRRRQGPRRRGRR